MSKHWLGLLSLATVLLMACGSGPTPMSTSMQTTTPEVTIQVIKSTGTYREVVQTDYVELPNCSGSGELVRTIERSRSIRHEVDLEAEVEVNVTGKAEVLGTGVEVGAAVAARYGTTYGTEETSTHSLTFKIKEGTNIRYDFQWVEIWQLGQLQIRVGEQEQIIPYRFRQDLTLETVNSHNLGCPTEIAGGGGAAETTAPTPEETPTIARPLDIPTSGATTERPWFGPISFCLQIDTENRCINPTTRLPAGITKFYVSWEFAKIPYGAQFDRYWYHNGNRLRHVPDQWDSDWGSPTGVEFTYYQYNQGFANGEYRLELYINGELLQIGSAYIGP